MRIGRCAPRTSTGRMVKKKKTRIRQPTENIFRWVHWPFMVTSTLIFYIIKKCEDYAKVKESFATLHVGFLAQ
jgi:hypothetical protein